jgi:hypothetical protein
MGWKGKE